MDTGIPFQELPTAGPTLPLNPPETPLFSFPMIKILWNEK